MLSKPPDYVILGTTNPQPGSLAIVVPEHEVERIGNYEREQKRAFWHVRAIISDHIPLAGSLADILSRRSENMITVNDNPLTIYLHAGGRDAIYYDLVPDHSGNLAGIAVRVETAKPLSSFFHGRQAVNQFLDVLATRPAPMPLTIQRLELISPQGDEVLAYQVILPYQNALSIGPLGGIQRWLPFAPYDAIFREAITSSSPFYRLLCACRVYEGGNAIRKWMKEQRSRLNLTSPLPKDPDVDTAELEQMGLSADFCRSIKRAGDLFEKLREYRNGIAHFLVEGKQGSTHMYLADSGIQHQYFQGATVLLRYAGVSIEALKAYYSTNLSRHFMRGQILPMLESRDKFNVVAPE
jgi:hypothetical protein